ncbi:MAG: hypothetical protein ABI629_12110 [bacterium]
MSLRANDLFERIRDLKLQSDNLETGEQTARERLGREVLQALHEIDRVSQATALDAGAQGSRGGDTVATRLSVAIAGQSSAVLGTVCGLTDIRTAAARRPDNLISAAASIRLIGAAASIRVTGRPR